MPLRTDFNKMIIMDDEKSTLFFVLPSMELVGWWCLPIIQFSAKQMKTHYIIMRRERICLAPIKLMCTFWISHIRACARWNAFIRIEWVDGRGSSDNRARCKTPRSMQSRRKESSTTIMTPLLGLHWHFRLPNEWFNIKSIHKHCN